MSDDLRDRIAKALYGQILHPVPLFDSQPDEVKHAWLADADAVIEALGSDCIYRYACHRCGDFWFDTSERMQRFALLHGKAHDDD